MTGQFARTLDQYGPKLGPRRMMKFGIKYSELHPFARRVRDAFIKIKNTDDLQAVLDEWYDPGKDWPSTTRPTGPGDLIAAGALPDQD